MSGGASFANAGFQVMAGIQQLRAAKDSKKAAKRRAKAAAEEAAALQLESVTQQAAFTRNAIAAELTADRAQQEALKQADDIRSIAEQVNGSVQAQAVKSGVSVTSGSVLDVMAENVFNVELRAQQAITQGEERAGALRFQGQELRRQASGLAAALPAQVDDVVRRGSADARALMLQSLQQNTQAFQSFHNASFAIARGVASSGGGGAGGGAGGGGGGGSFNFAQFGQMFSGGGGGAPAGGG